MGRLEWSRHIHGPKGQGQCSMYGSCIEAEHIYSPASALCVNCIKEERREVAFQWEPVVTILFEAAHHFRRTTEWTVL